MLRLRARSIALISLASTAPLALATGPDVPLDPTVFDYSNPNYLGANFGYASQLSYTSFLEGGGIDQAETDFLGNIVPPELLGNAFQFSNGDPIHVTTLNETDFPNGFQPPALQQLNTNVEFSGVTDANGFSSFTATHKTFAHLDSQDGASDFAFAQLAAQLVFDVDADEAESIVNLVIAFDAITSFFGDGGGSQGVTAQIIDLANPDNPVLMNEISGFYAEFDGQLDVFFEDQDGNDLNSFFSFNEGEDANEAAFNMEIPVALQNGGTYALNILSDLGADVFGEGSSLIDSSNSFNVSIVSADNNTRFIVPGSVVPGPASLGLLGAGGLVAIRRRRT